MAKSLHFVILLSATLSVGLSKHEIYEGHSLYEVAVADSEQAKIVNGLENQINIDVFSYAHPDREGYILVPEDLKEYFEEVLTSHGIKYNMQVENIKEQLEMEDEALAAASARISRNSSGPGLNFNEIHRLEVVDEYLDRLADLYPDTVTVVSNTKTFQERDIKYLKISTTNFEDRNKPVIFIMSLLHAREWVTLPATLYAIEKLVIDLQEPDLLTTMDWIILPVANPDGYRHTHTNGRLWRKNRRTGFYEDDLCLGVDLNRNFDSPFWGTLSSNHPCRDNFHGPNAFSEQETINIRNILAEYRDRMAYFGDMHSHGSLILYGMGNGELPSNALVLNLNAVNQAQAIDAVKWESKRYYRVGNIRNVLYAASGISSDYVTTVGVPFSYSYELPPYRNISNLNGFYVDPEFIWQAGFETWEGIKTGARFARDVFWGRKDMLN